MDSTRGYYLMKTITKHRKRGLLLSLLCAGAAAIFLSGCAEAPYVTANDTGYYYPTGNPVRDYWGYYQPYPFSDTPYGPRYRIIDGMHVYEPYPYPGY
jgi:hypothetical protein